MRAIRYYGPGDVRLDEIPEPEAGVKQIKIKVRSTNSLPLYVRSCLV